MRLAGSIRHARHLASGMARAVAAYAATPVPARPAEGQPKRPQDID